MMNVNVDAFYFINNSLQNPFFDAVMPALSNAGGFLTLLALCILAVILSNYLKREKCLEIAKLCLFALILSGIIAGCLKLCFHSPRPFTVLANVRQLVIPTEPNSFPSGHTSSTLAVVTVLVWKLRKHKLICALLVLFAFLIGFSRVYVGVHYPLDVLTGAAVGIISGAIVLAIKKHLEEKL